MGNCASRSVCRARRKSRYAQAHLAAVACGVGACLIAGFDNEALAQQLALPTDEIPILLMTLSPESETHD